jgi:hypothetical protein
MRTRLASIVATSLVAGCIAYGGFDEATAHACGGCFSPPSERTVVTDHRMAFSISKQQTVLWDQIRYAGDPKEFSWVLPVRPGAEVEVSNDEFFSALDASTQPVIRAPFQSFANGGCALTGCASDESASAMSAGGEDQVQIIKQAVVGPYETVTLRATDPDALTKWLDVHGFELPPAIQPTIDAYVSEGFDFIALRLRPVCNERSMRPVRIVSPGADASLPLRMIAAGVGARVGITLYVISEGRYHPQNFPDATLDFSNLTWDRIRGRSNYEELSQAAMGQNAGRSWLTEYANHPDLYASPYGPRSSGSANPGLAESYLASCRGFATPSPSGTSTSSPNPSPSGTPCDRDAGTGDQDAEIGLDAGDDADGLADASDDASDDASNAPGDAGDAGTDGAVAKDAGKPAYDAGRPAYDAGSYPPPSTDRCKSFDDLDVALKGMNDPSNVWVTRLRAVLPIDALAVGDLRLEPVPGQAPVTNLHQATRFSDQSNPDAGANGATTTRQSDGGCTSASRRNDAFGSLMILGTSVLGISALLRRRRRR